MKKIIILILSLLPFLSFAGAKNVETAKPIIDHSTIRVGSNGQIRDYYGYRIFNGVGQWMYWADHIIGSGSGTVAQNTMAGLASGDRLLMVAGIYTLSQFTFLNNIVITTQTGLHDVFFNGNGSGGSLLTMNNNNGVDFRNVELRNVSAGFKAINLGGGNNQNCTWHNLHGTNVLGAFFHFGVNKVYTWGNNATAQIYNSTMDSISIIGLGQLCTGAFASIDAGGGPYDVTDGLTISNVYMEGITNQDQIVGVYVHALFDNIKSVLPNQGTPVTDKGFIQAGDGSGGWGNFQGTISRVAVYGGRGKLFRMHAITFHTGTRDSTIVKNCGKFNTSNYGFGDVYNSVIHGTIAGHTIGASVIVENCSAGNMTTVNAFPTAMMFIGPSNAGTTRLRNLLVFNNVIDGNGNIYNSSGGTWTVDTLKCWRYASSASAGLDGTGTNPTFIPQAGSAVSGQGIHVNISVDYYNVGYLNPPSIGWAEVAGSPIPPPPSSCVGCVTYRRRTTAVNSGAITYDVDAQKLIDSAHIGTLGVRQALSTFVTNLKSNSFWTGIAWMHPHATDAALSNAQHLEQMKWNIKNVANTDGAYRLTAAGTLTADSIGVKGDGTTGYRSTHFRQAGFSSINANTFVYASGTNQNRFETQMGSRDFDGGFNVRMLYLTVTNSSLNYGNVADPDIAHAGLGSTLGVYAGMRTGVNKTYVWRNGAVLDSAATASVNYGNNVDMTINARGNAPADNFSSTYISFDAAWDRSFTPAEMTTLMGIINQYLKDMETALGLTAGKKGSY